MFYVDMGHFFGTFIFIFLCLQFSGYPIYKEEKEGSSHRPATRIFVQKWVLRCV